jgi:hypothetical protein
LLTFFNPALKSVRALQQASELDQVQRKLHCKRVRWDRCRSRPRVRRRRSNRSLPNWPSDPRHAGRSKPGGSSAVPPPSMAHC